MDRLRLITTFLNVAQEGNFTRAAVALRISPQAVSAQISQLEDWLNVRLFNRTTRSLSLTEEGGMFLAKCKMGLRLIDEGETEVRERTNDAVGLVRLGTSVSLGHGLIAPMIARFCQLNPRIQVELITQYSLPDVVEMGVDVGVTAGPLPSSSLVARRAGSFHHVLCATPEYLRRRPAPLTPEDLAKHLCIGLRHPRTNRIWPWSFKHGNKIQTLDIPLSMITKDPTVQRQVTLSGGGIAQLPSYFAIPLLDAKVLQEVQLGYASPKLDLHVFLPRRTKVPKKSRLLSEFLLAELKVAHHR